MKKLFFFLFINTLWSQDFNNIKIEDRAITPIVVQVQETDAEKLYNLAVEWVYSTFKDPEIALKSAIEGKFIIVEAVEKNALEIQIGKDSGGILYNMRYTLKIEFRDGRYKYSIVDEVVFYHNGTKVFNLGYLTKNQKKPKAKQRQEKGIKYLEETLNRMHDNFNLFVTRQSIEDW